MNNAIRAGVTRLDMSPTGNGWLLFAFAASDSATFDAARAAVAQLPHYARKWLPQARAWRVKSWALWSLAPQWPALRDALEEMGISREHRRAEYDEDTYTPPPPRLYAPQRVADAFAALQLTPGAPLGLIEAARRYWAKALHPDVSGGDTTEAMKRINVAADMCEAFARQRSRAA